MYTIRYFLASDDNELRRVVNSAAFKFHIDRDELFQICAVKVLTYSKPIEFPDLETFLPWWNRICKNAAIDIYRGRKKNYLHTDIEVAFDLGVMPKMDLDYRALLARAYRLIRREGSKHSALLLYMSNSGYTYDELAIHFNMAPSTVRVKIHQIRKLFGYEKIAKKVEEGKRVCCRCRRKKALEFFHLNYRQCKVCLHAIHQKTNLRKRYGK